MINLHNEYSDQSKLSQLVEKFWTVEEFVIRSEATSLHTLHLLKNASA